MMQVIVALYFFRHSDAPCWSVQQMFSVCFTLVHRKPHRDWIYKSDQIWRQSQKSKLQHQDQLQSGLVLTSALNPGDHVVEQEEDNDQANGDIAEDAAVVSAGSHHGGETLHAAAQQAGRTQEVWVLKGRRSRDCE